MWGSGGSGLSLTEGTPVGLVFGFVGSVHLLPAVLTEGRMRAGMGHPSGIGCKDSGFFQPQAEVSTSESSPNTARDDGWDLWGHPDSGSHLGTTSKYTQWGCIARLLVGIWYQKNVRGGGNSD